MQLNQGNTLCAVHLCISTFMWLQDILRHVSCTLENYKNKVIKHALVHLIGISTICDLSSDLVQSSTSLFHHHGWCTVIVAWIDFCLDGISYFAICYYPCNNYLEWQNMTLECVLNLSWFDWLWCVYMFSCQSQNMTSVRYNTT